MRKHLLMALPAATLALTAAAHAQTMPAARTQTPGAATLNYWTPERMKAAQPIDLRPSSLPKLPSQVPTHVGAPVFHPGSAPAFKQDLGNMHEPEARDQQLQLRNNTVLPPNVGNGGDYFTTSRVFPTAAPKTYPNSAAGILYFTDPATGSNYICSASAISHRLIVTAGHCTAHASTTAPYFYTNWLFVPAYNNGAAPYGKWTVSYATTTSNWYYSDGSVPNVQDIGVLVANDQTYKRAVHSVGDVTGWLGWWTQWGRSYPNNVTQLGYPCNLDSCAMMEYNTAQGSGTWNNTVEIGSAMQGGSSGGPWIQDYGVAPAGAPAYTAGNWVLGVTSWGYTDTSQMVQGASIFENAGYSGGGFGDLWNGACNEASGNC